jgi:thymidine phosphorylase
VRELTIELCAELLVSTNVSRSLSDARSELAKRLDDGSAYVRFEEMVQHQGGKLDDLPNLAPHFEWTASDSGFIKAIDGQKLGYAVIALGGGRKAVGQPIDPTVGLEMLCRVNDKVDRGAPLVKVFASKTSDVEAAKALLKEAFTIGTEKVPTVPLYEKI